LEKRGSVEDARKKGYHRSYGSALKKGKRARKKKAKFQ